MPTFLITPKAGAPASWASKRLLIVAIPSPCIGVRVPSGLTVVISYAGIEKGG
jgi:hypothetical protein